MDFSITPSPLPEIPVYKYDAARFPKFRYAFETDSALGTLSQDSNEALWAVVIENLSDKDLPDFDTAMSRRWRTATSKTIRIHPTATSSMSFVRY
jgi:hypothetical protein